MDKFKGSFKLKDKECLNPGSMISKDYKMLGILVDNLYLLQRESCYHKDDLLYFLEGLDLVYCAKTNLNCAVQLELDIQQCLSCSNKKLE